MPSEEPLTALAVACITKRKRKQAGAAVSNLNGGDRVTCGYCNTNESMCQGLEKKAKMTYKESKFEMLFTAMYTTGSSKLQNK